MPLIHPTYHNFRDYEPAKFVGKRTMMNFTYLTAAERASLQQSSHKAMFLSANEPVADTVPHEYRPKNRENEIQPRFQ